MFVNKTVKIYLRIYFIILKTLSVFPYVINEKTREINYSIGATIWSLIYPPITTFAFTSYFATRIYQEKLFYDEELKAQSVLDHSTNLMIVFCILITFSKFKPTRIIYIKLKNVFDKLIILNIKCNYSADAQFFFKKFLITQIFIWCFCFSFYLIMQESIKTIESAIYFLLYSCVRPMIGSAIMFQYAGFLCVIRISFSHIQKIISEKLQGNLCKTSEWHKIKFECELSDILDKLSDIQMELFEISKDVSKNFSFQLLLIFAYIFMVIETQFFQIYQVLTYKGQSIFITQVIVLVSMLFWSIFRVLEVTWILKETADVMKMVMYFFYYFFYSL